MTNTTLSFKVAGVRTEPGDVEAMLGGSPVKAIVDRLVLDLVSANGEQGFQLKMPIVAAADLDAQREAFTVGAAVSVTIAAEASAPEAQPAIDAHDQA